MDAYIMLVNGQGPASEVVDAVAEVVPDAAMYAVTGHDDFNLLVVTPARATGKRELDALGAELSEISLIDRFVIMQGTPAVPTRDLDRLWTLGFEQVDDLL